MTTQSSTLAPARAWYYSIPVFGWIAHDLTHGVLYNIWYFLVICLTLLVLAIRTWGLVELGLTALAAVPVMFVVLFLITLGR